MSVSDNFMDMDEGSGGPGRWLRIAIPLALFVVLAAGVWYLLNNPTGVRREAPRLQTILATLPPPPPPPPKERPPEPEKKLEEIPKPSETPKQLDAPKPMTINGPAQAGNDAFNIGAGDGTGMVASTNGFGDASYSRYLGSTIQQMIQQDDHVNRLVFSIEVAIWVDGSGHLKQARILRSSGDDKTDDAVLAALQGMPSLDQAPPSSLQFPQRVAIRGKRVG